jgi:oligopeptidase A
MPVMQYADHHGLRETMYRAYVTRASELGRAEWDNTSIMKRILELRREMARLLGYGSYADVSLATKMAAEPREALAFLEDLADRARPFAERDMAELRDFARAEMSLADVRAPDVAYVSEKLRQRRYSFSDQEVKQYFPEDEVLAGMFRVVETIYGVHIRPGEAETWHPSVRFFEIVDAAWSASSISTSTHATPSEGAPGWATRSIAGGSPLACRRRSHSSPATSPGPWPASPRSSRTAR